MRIILLALMCLFSSGCGSHGIYFKEVEDGIIIKPLNRQFLFFPSKLASGKYEYSNNGKTAVADFKKEPMKLIDISFPMIKK